MDKKLPKNKKVEMKKQNVASLQAKLHALIDAADKTLPGHSLEEAESMCSVINDNSPMDFGDFKIKDATLKKVAEIYDKDDSKTDPEYDGRQPTEFLYRYFIEVTVEGKGSVKRMLLSQIEKEYNLNITNMVNENNALTPEKKEIAVNMKKQKSFLKQGTSKQCQSFSPETAAKILDKYSCIEGLTFYNKKQTRRLEKLMRHVGVGHLVKPADVKPNDVIIIAQWICFDGDLQKGKITHLQFVPIFLTDFNNELESQELNNLIVENKQHLIDLPMVETLPDNREAANIYLKYCDEQVNNIQFKRDSAIDFFNFVYE